MKWNTWKFLCISKLFYDFLCLKHEREAKSKGREEGRVQDRAGEEVKERNIGWNKDDDFDNEHYDEEDYMVVVMMVILMLINVN